MKAISAALASYLAGVKVSDEVLTIADCFTLTFITGEVLSLTNYDQDVTWNGTTFTARSILIDGLKYKCSIGLEVDKQQITISAYPNQTFKGAPILRALAGGAFDGCRMQRWRVFLSNYLPGGADGVLVFQGRVSTVDSVGRTQSKVTIASDLVVLEYDMPHNLFSATCSHVLYDQGCGVNKGLFAFSGSVGAGSSQTTILWGGANVGMAQGAILFETGLNAGVRTTIRSAVDGASLTLLYPLPSPPTVGDIFTAYFGCDHTIGTCKAKFNNVQHFRGFPFVPPVEMTV